MSIQTLGQSAYERYKTVQHGRGHNGKKLGTWKDLTEDQREEWERAAIQMGKAQTAIRGSLKERPSGGKRV